jgi:uncharacterized protein
MVLKSAISQAYEEQQEYLLQKEVGQIRTLLDSVELSSIYVLIITGIRRCGKSTLMRQLMNRTENSCSFFNFEDPRISNFEVSDFAKLNEIMGNEISHYFFDEIQNVEGWELFIRNLHDKENVICITGSNASLLSKELGTRLTGRNIQVELFPFSFEEFCNFEQLPKTDNSYKDYISLGGFPDYLKTKQPELLQQLFKDIIYRDIIVRHGIRNANTFIDLAQYLISNVAKEYSLNSLKKIFNIGSANSVSDYVSWLEDAYVLFSLPKFSWSAKSVAVNPKKVYTIDTGFAKANSLSFSKDEGRLLENAIYLTIRRKYKEIYYFREQNECDFLIFQNRQIVKAIQVCTALHDDNYQREVNGVLEAMQFFNLNEGFIITLNQQDTISIEGKTIHLVKAHEFEV